jgi:hypothetical protein
MRFLILIMIGLSLANASDVYVDSAIGLIWQDNNDAKSVKKEWEGAKKYCVNLELNGHSDWRLPSIKELQSIVDISRYKPAIKKGFKNVNKSSGYWSSSVYVADSKLALLVNFENGHTGSNYIFLEDYYVRCVRGRQ